MIQLDWKKFIKVKSKIIIVIINRQYITAIYVNKNNKLKNVKKKRIIMYLCMQ